jgi:hypothetical protein
MVMQKSHMAVNRNRPSIERWFVVLAPLLLMFSIKAFAAEGYGAIGAVHAEAPITSMPFERHQARDLIALKSDPLLDGGEWILTTKSLSGDGDQPHIPSEIYLLVEGRFGQIQPIVKNVLVKLGTFETISGMYAFGDARLGDDYDRRTKADEYNFDEFPSIMCSECWTKIAVVRSPEIRQAWMDKMAEKARAIYKTRPPGNTEALDQSIKDAQNCSYIQPGDVPLKPVAYFYATQAHEQKRYGFLQGYFGSIRTRRRLSVEMADVTTIFGRPATYIRLARADTYPDLDWKWYDPGFVEHGGLRKTDGARFVPLSILDAVTKAVSKDLGDGKVIVGNLDQWGGGCL